MATLLVHSFISFFTHYLMHMVPVLWRVHRVHHLDTELGVTNGTFGAVFPIWDLVFGTFHATPRDGYERMRIGPDEVRGREAHRPLWLLGSVFSKQLTVTAGSAQVARQSAEVSSD